MEKWVDAPTNIYEFLFGSPWPLRWAYVLMAALALLSIGSWKWRVPLPLGVLLLPLAWFVWQCLASAHSVDPALTRATLPHLAGCVLCFYIGVLALWRSPGIRFFWPGVLAGFLLMVFAAWEQHFGGLDETRKYFWTYVYPGMDMYPTDYIRKITSNRVFGTLFYPNTLAAAIILLLPPISAKVWQWTGNGRFTTSARAFILIVWAAITLACMFWSGSKGGWLVLMTAGLIGFFRWPGIAPKFRVLAAAALIVAGLGGFFWTYASFFKRGAPSVGARFDYWTAAVKNASLKPIYGSGPGTFAVPYAQLKTQQSEMSRLVHNDYLQQASDSGIPGFLFYAAFITAALFQTWKSTSLVHASRPWDSPKLVPFAVWLGLTGWFLHSFIEFNLYVPALAWTAFLLLGWLLGTTSGTPCTSPPGSEKADG